jgi:hypothetical protein
MPLMLWYWREVPTMSVHGVNKILNVWRSFKHYFKYVTRLIYSEDEINSKTIVYGQPTDLLHIKGRNRNNCRST